MKMGHAETPVVKVSTKMCEPYVTLATSFEGLGSGSYGIIYGKRLCLPPGPMARLYWCLKTGFRFSMNALRPSWQSSVSNVE